MAAPTGKQWKSIFGGLSSGIANQLGAGLLGQAQGTHGIAQQQNSTLSAADIQRAQNQLQQNIMAQDYAMRDAEMRKREARYRQQFEAEFQGHRAKLDADRALQILDRLPRDFPEQYAPRILDELRRLSHSDRFNVYSQNRPETDAKYLIAEDKNTGMRRCWVMTRESEASGERRYIDVAFYGKVCNTSSTDTYMMTSGSSTTTWIDVDDYKRFSKTKKPKDAIEKLRAEMNAWIPSTEACRRMVCGS